MTLGRALGRREQYWIWISAVGLIALTPFLLFPGGWRTWALAGLPLIWIGNRLLTGHFVRRTPFDVVILFLLVMVLVSLYATYDMSLSLPKIAGVLLGVSAFYAVANFTRTPAQLRLFAGALLLGMVLFIGLALVGTNWGRKVPILQQIGAGLPAIIRGLPGADTGGTLTWIIFLPLALVIGLWPRRHSWRVSLALLGLSLLFVVMGATLLLTQSRSAWLGAVAGMSLLLWLFGRWGRWLLLVGVIVALLGVLALGPDRFLPGAGARSTPDQLGSVLNPSLSDRAEIWSRAIYGLQDFPLTGMGLGMFRYVMPVLYPLFTVSPEVDLGHAHNEWLQTGTDLGFPGLIVFSALQGLGLGLAYLLFRFGIRREVRWLMAGVCAGFAAQIVFGLTDAVALGAKPGLFWWLLLGLVAATWQVFKETGRSTALGQLRSA